ncbi:MAG: substrate-binding domain-containing protein [Ruminococcus sp.]|nr:substrate-binding domain-containing protein [Ruminococcus sp.]
MKRRKLIGVVITDCYIRFQEDILRGVIRQAFRTGCDIAVIAPFNNFYSHSLHKDTEKEIFKLLLSDRFDGFLYDRSSFFGEEITKHLDALLLRTGKPVMLLDSDDHRSFESTSIDDAEAFETITSHLIEVHGLKRIYCLTGPKNIYVAEERLKGYRSAMKNHGITPDKSWMRYGDFWKESAKQLAAEIARGDIARPEAVVCGNDNTAESLISALAEYGIRVPEDIAVTGYDNNPEAEDFEPAITTYSRPNFQMGAEAFRRLYRIITGRICNKIPNREGGLCIGESCGCGVKHAKKKPSRLDRMGANYEKILFHGDMLFDITNAEDPLQFSDRLDSHTFMLYKMKDLFICLTKKYIDSAAGSFTDKLTFECGDDVRLILAKHGVVRRYPGPEYFSSADLLPFYSEDRPYPSAFYISPLNYNDNFFGYSALSFGKLDMSFSSLYIRWVTYVDIALEQVRIRSFMNSVISNANKALLYDDYTGLPNRNGMMMEFSRKLSSAPHSSLECLRFELTGISKTYYQSGEEKCRRIVAGFAGAVKKYLSDDEVCGLWESDSVAVLTQRHNRADELYPLICANIRESNGPDSCNVDFVLGAAQVTLTPDQSLPDVMHQAMVNRRFTYTLSEQNSNPQFEKLCMLRNRMMKNPENSWSISEIAEELYLSKSYLQKIYKSYFGSSIIEEMIHFRIDKAKDLLLHTDMTVTEISRECGYSSYNYFVRQFRAEEGMSPSEFRISAKGSGQ